jgi:hypothetical protein
MLGPAVGFLLLVALVYLFSSCIPYVGSLLVLFIVVPMYAGMYIVCLAQLQGKSWTFGDFFAGFQYYGPLLLNSLLLGLMAVPIYAVLIPLVLLANQADTGIIIALGVALFLVLCATMYVLTRAGTFCWLLILDRGYGPLEAIRGSWNLSRGHFWSLFGVGLLLGLVNLGGEMLLCVGLLFTMPLTALVWTAGYLLVAGTRPPLEAPRSAREY